MPEADRMISNYGKYRRLQGNQEEHAEALDNCFREIRLNDANYKRI